MGILTMANSDITHFDTKLPVTIEQVYKNYFSPPWGKKILFTEDTVPQLGNLYETEYGFEFRSASKSEDDTETRSPTSVVEMYTDTNGPPYKTVVETFKNDPAGILKGFVTPAEKTKGRRRDIQECALQFETWLNLLVYGDGEEYFEALLNLDEEEVKKGWEFNKARFALRVRPALDNKDEEELTEALLLHGLGASLSTHLIPVSFEWIKQYKSDENPTKDFHKFMKEKMREFLNSDDFRNDLDTTFKLLVGQFFLDSTEEEDKKTREILESILDQLIERWGNPVSNNIVGDVLDELLRVVGELRPQELTTVWKEVSEEVRGPAPGGPGCPAAGASASSF